MKKMHKSSLFLLLAIFMATAFCGCSDDNDTVIDEEKEKVLTEISKQYVNNTVIETYRSLADETNTLYNAIVELKAEKTNAKVKAAADSWIKARNYWELSEAWLYGPADDFGIDPHIDTWPLDKNALEKTILTNDAYIKKMSEEDGDVWAGTFFEDGLLGFHGIEYILFENGVTKDISRISDKELIYSAAVAGDLRNQCFRLEAAWAGVDNIATEKKEKLVAIKAKITYEGTSSYYGEAMLNPGTTAFCESPQDACETIIEGCITIADEVGAMKIGQPFTGEDINYIESPYSYNSKIDFIGNIESIRNAYIGGVAGKRGASLSAFIKSANPAVDEEILTAIDNAVAKIEAIPYPFAKNYTSKEAGEAMKACQELGELLKKAKTVIRE